MRIDVSLDLSQLVDWDLVPAKDIKEALKAATASYMLDQRKNIKAGRTVNGAPFVKYSKKYLDKKTRAGRMSGPSGSVDNIKGSSSYWLRLTGQMMRSQKIHYKRFGKGYQATVAFEGMQAPAAFMASGGKKNRAKGKGRLVVNFTPGDMISSSFLAWENNKYRPFIGMNQKMLNNAYRAFRSIIKRSSGSVKHRNA